MTFFNNIEKIKYEGKDSKNQFAFKYYNPDEVIMGKTMKEHLKFSVAYWHTFNADGNDPFGNGTMDRSWGSNEDAMDHAKKRLEAAFEFFTKLDVPYFAFHDRDIAPEGKTLRETNENLDVIIDLIEKKVKETGVKVLWNTANAFSHPRFVHGAGTSSNADVFAYTAAQVKKGLETAKRLGSESYVFWGGREGYECLLNTDMKLELDNLAKLFHMAVDYADEIGYTGQFLIEPKPKEPSKHQYDFDAQSATAFLLKYGLSDRFKFNIEANHATLAGHTFEHELRYCRDNNMLGSVDANQGDVMLGWDTDEFPTDLHSATLAMYEILKNGGLEKGGLNFDAKVRRTSIDFDDLFLGHIAGMDTFARALRNAAKLIEDKFFENIIDEKYASYKTGIGADIVAGKADMKSLEAYILDKEITNKSGRVELIRNRLNDYIY